MSRSEFSGLFYRRESSASFPKDSFGKKFCMGVLCGSLEVLLEVSKFLSQSPVCEKFCWTPVSSSEEVSSASLPKDTRDWYEFTRSQRDRSHEIANLRSVIGLSLWWRICQITQWSAVIPLAWLSGELRLESGVRVWIVKWTSEHLIEYLSQHLSWILQLSPRVVSVGPTLGAIDGLAIGRDRER